MSQWWRRRRATAGDGDRVQLVAFTAWPGAVLSHLVSWTCLEHGVHGCVEVSEVLPPAWCSAVACECCPEAAAFAKESGDYKANLAAMAKAIAAVAAGAGGSFLQTTAGATRCKLSVSVEARAQPQLWMRAAR